MFQLEASENKILADYGCNYRISYRGGTVQRDESGKIVVDERKVPIIGAGTLVAEIIDLATGESYIFGHGDDAKSAVQDGVAKIPSTSKPQTKAQKLVEATIRGDVDAKEAETAVLKARLAQLEKWNQERIDAEAAKEPPEPQDLTQPEPHDMVMPTKTPARRRAAAV